MSENVLDNKNIQYIYTHKVTRATTGYFSCLPEPAPSFKEALNLLHEAPLDDFLHRHILHEMLQKSVEDLTNLLPKPLEENPILAALICECTILNAEFASLASYFSAEKIFFLADFTPLPYLQAALRPEQDLHKECSLVFAENIYSHHPLPHPDDEDLPLLYELPAGEEDRGNFTIAECFAKFDQSKKKQANLPTVEETTEIALQRLQEAKIIAGAEMRHEASLSPIALLRPWNIDIAVKNKRLNYTLKGVANVYGRGLSLARARVSYAMEMVERASAYMHVNENELPLLATEAKLIYASYKNLLADGAKALNPDLLPLDIPYNNQALHWIEAKTAQGAAIFVPAQFVFLFFNLDEPTLLLDSGSTGLASGNTLAQAKVSALCEIIERDAECILPYQRRRCFTLTAEDEKINALLESYVKCGINVQFQDLTSSFGVPCYQSFVSDNSGKVFRATGASLSGYSAIISALTETPYPYPHGKPSGIGLRGIEQKKLESLPDFSMPSPEDNLELLEEVFTKNGFTPLYIDLTRKDLNLPVVRAIVPGLESGAEFDNFSRIRPRLFYNYLLGR